MPRKFPAAAWKPLMAVVVSCGLCGCTGFQQYLDNHFRVGPDYCPPEANVAEQWIDKDDERVGTVENDLSNWWTVFRDPALNSLITTASEQNLSLKEAGYRILQARAQLAIAEGNLFPQKQIMTGNYTHQMTPKMKVFGAFEVPQKPLDIWASGFNLAWELDFWGRFRRAIDAADARLNASVESYDDVLVTLLSDIATNYVQMRVLEDEIKSAREGEDWQQQVLDYHQKRAGKLQTPLDAYQAEAALMQTKAQIPLFETAKRQATNRLCILLGTPPAELEHVVGAGAIPEAPREVAVGIPAELLSRRPDVRRAEREAAAQAQQIGIAEADLYPSLAITGAIGYQGNEFRDVFASTAFNGNIGPSFQWNILNYGRIKNNVRFQDARFQELLVRYQSTVLLANEEVENALVSFLRAQDRVKSLDQSVKALTEARKVLLDLERVGESKVDVGGDPYLRRLLIEQDLVRQKDLLAQARGQIAQGLIRVYKALGGGWEIRLQSSEQGSATAPLPPPEAPTPAPGRKPAAEGTSTTISDS